MTFAPTSQKGTLLGAGSEFFNSLTTGLSQGIQTIGSELLPTWTAQQLDVQSEDQLDQSTFEPKWAPPKAGGYNYTTIADQEGGEPKTDKTLLDTYQENLVNMSTSTALILGIGLVIAGYTVYKMVT
jgi:hypothetical protein